MNLSDEVVAHIAQLVQIAILTGTDIVDNLRAVELVNDEGTNKLFLTEDYRAKSDDNIKRMIDEVEQLGNEQL
tara:strand:- start:3895 stop:4113 length:219 start_codon:yes stop_codon:yes gene_type:complete